MNDHPADLRQAILETLNSCSDPDGFGLTAEDIGRHVRRSDEAINEAARTLIQGGLITHGAMHVWSRGFFDVYTITEAGRSALAGKLEHSS
jgi:hypothetical protein